MHPDQEPNISRPALPNYLNNDMTIVFLNFSDGANLHQSVRFSSSAVRLSPDLSLDAPDSYLPRAPRAHKPNPQSSLTHKTQK